MKKKHNNEVLDNLEEMRLLMEEYHKKEMKRRAEQAKITVGEWEDLKETVTRLDRIIERADLVDSKGRDWGDE